MCGADAGPRGADSWLPVDAAPGSCQRARSGSDRRRFTVAHGHVTMPLTCVKPGRRHRFDDLPSSWSLVRSLPGALREFARQRGSRPFVITVKMPWGASVPVACRGVSRAGTAECRIAAGLFVVGVGDTLRT